MINWLDFVLFALVFSLAANGWRRGLVRQFFDVAGLIVAYIVALSYGSDLAAWLQVNMPLSPDWLDITLPGGLHLADIFLKVVSFVMLFAVARVLLQLAGRIMHGVFSLPLLGTVNATGGVLLGAVKGILLIIIAVAFISLIDTPFWQEAVEESVVATYVAHWLPFIYDQVTEFFNSVVQQNTAARLFHCAGNYIIHGSYNPMQGGL